MNSFFRKYGGLGLHVAVCAFACLFAAKAALAEAGRAPSSAWAMSASELAARFPAGSIDSTETADRALYEAGFIRSRVEAQFINEESGCYQKFFTTTCIDKAKETRRHALGQVHPIEVEANVYKRRETVVKRDKALEEKLRQEQDEAPQRATEQADREKAASEKAADREQHVKSVEEQHRNAPEDSKRRAADHDAKVKRAQAEEAANVKKRADNAVEFEKKAKESQARQHEVAAKKAEKERERAKKTPKPPAVSADGLPPPDPVLRLPSP